MTDLPAPTFALIAKDGGRADFVAGDFDLAIRQRGYKLRWSAAELCPCRLNDDTEQPDPTCTFCDGGGFLYTLPDATGLTLDTYLAEDPPFVDDEKSRATQGIITSMVKDTQLFEKFGEWVAGSAGLTTFSFNRLGFRDRLTMVDARHVYRQLLTLPEDKTLRVGGGRSIKAKLRYPCLRVIRAFELQTATTKKDWTEDATIQDDGSLVFSACPAGARLSIGMEVNPVWIVLDFPIAARGMLLKIKTTKALGRYETLPVHALVRLDYLVNDSTGLP